MLRSRGLRVETDWGTELTVRRARPSRGGGNDSNETSERAGATGEGGSLIGAPCVVTPTHGCRWWHWRSWQGLLGCSAAGNKQLSVKSSISGH